MRQRNTLLLALVLAAAIGVPVARAEIFGAVFVHKLLNADAVTIHYDTSVRADAARCTEPIPLR